jgi:hypothetical protein
MKDATSRVPEIWDEDLLLPRIYGVGFMRGVPAPAGAIYKIDPDAKNWERITSGFRNPFDIAFTVDGELFTFDADMEWDIGTPFYRPTRVCHAVSGVDWGWRNGSGKWPVYFADTVPPVVNVGLGSPTGITFGYGAKFPAKYQNTLFLCDWTYGKMYAVHLCNRQSARRGNVFSDWRPQDSVGVVSCDLCRQGIDGPGVRAPAECRRAKASPRFGSLARWRSSGCCGESVAVPGAQ